MSLTIGEQKAVTCPECGSTNVHQHDTYCDDEHEAGDDNSYCWPFYCDDCGEGFEA